jgi:hypothetical protein
VYDTSGVSEINSLNTKLTDYIGNGRVLGMLKKLVLTMMIIAAFKSYAEPFSYTGTVKKIRSHDEGLYSFAVDWAAIEGFSYAGSCKTSGGDVVLRLRDGSRADRQFAMFMAANLSNRAVSVTVDDTVKDGAGYCFLRHVDLR